MTDSIIRELAIKYNKDERVIRAITNSLFLFVKNKIRSLEDEAPIRIPYFGAFVIRYNMGKDKKQASLLREIIEKIFKEYEDKLKGNKSYLEGLMYSIDIILNVLEEKGFKDEQLVQHINDWKSRT